MEILANQVVTPAMDMMTAITTCCSHQVQHAGTMPDKPCMLNANSSNVLNKCAPFDPDCMQCLSFWGTCVCSICAIVATQALFMPCMTPSFKAQAESCCHVCIHCNFLSAASTCSQDCCISCRSRGRFQHAKRPEPSTRRSQECRHGVLAVQASCFGC